MPDLSCVIKQSIALHGPMSVETFWTLCLAHPEHGYYIKQDPLGAAGDFTTAPEISQLFGEMIGIWIAEKWQNLGSPSKIHLVECGPGRGTLMADALRIAKIVPNFLISLSIHLVETSPALRAKQAKALEGFNVTWQDDLPTIPLDAPILMIGNEFLDALPIRQYLVKEGQCFERVIGLNADEDLTWGLINAPHIPPSFENGKIFEQSSPRENFMKGVYDRIKTQSGAALMIDYGHDVSGFGDTFQAVRQHQFVDVLSHAGDADLTSHVDFGRLKQLAETQNLNVRLSGQGEFLERLGIHERAAQLKAKATSHQQSEIDAGLHRLVANDGMGQLFRVMEVNS